MEEVGELARIMTRVYGDQSFKCKDEKKDLADVLFVTECIANQSGVDLVTALAANLAKKWIVTAPVITTIPN